jgi:hypothetical protein
MLASKNWPARKARSSAFSPLMFFSGPRGVRGLRERSRGLIRRTCQRGAERFASSARAIFLSKSAISSLQGVIGRIVGLVFDVVGRVHLADQGSQSVDLHRARGAEFCNRQHWFSL